MKEKTKRTIGKYRIPISRFMVMIISLFIILILVISSAVFMSLFRKSAYETATLNTEQIVSQAASMVELYTDAMKKDLKIMQTQIEKYETEEEIIQYINFIAKTRSTVASIIVYDKEGNILYAAPEEEKIKENLKNDLSFQPELSG